ncbi:MAG: hypothetical protein QM766_09840 [Burkholderiaceae bacterium]
MSVETPSRRRLEAAETDADATPAIDDDARSRQAAAARLAANEAADLNWSQSVSRARTRPRSSEGSLYNLDARPSYHSTVTDWSVGLGVIGGLLMLVYCVRGLEIRAFDQLIGPTLLGIGVGAIAGVLIHWLFGLDRLRRARKDN